MLLPSRQVVLAHLVVVSLLLLRLYALQIPHERQQLRPHYHGHGRTSKGPKNNFGNKLPLSFVGALVAALQAPTMYDAIPIFVRHWTNKNDDGNVIMEENTALPIAYVPFSKLTFGYDCVNAQRRAARAAISSSSSIVHPSFLLELTPSDCNLKPNDIDGQVRWIRDNAGQLEQWKLEYGAVFFRDGWNVFSHADGVHRVVSDDGLGYVPCRDPKEIRGPSPLLRQQNDDSSYSSSTIIYETLNNPEDAQTHLGLHNEGIPGIVPSSALFCCFEPATRGGGEFMLCDGRAVFRDLNTTTLARLERRHLRPTYAVVPDWIVGTVPFHLLSLFTNWTRPTDDFMLDKFPEEQQQQQQSSIKLTTHSSVPVLRHPITGQEVWWSGIDSGHRGNFYKDNPHLVPTKSNNNNTSTNSGRRNDDDDDGGDGRDGTKGRYASEVFDVRYGDDGTEILEEDLYNIRRACEQHTRTLAMKSGDAVLVDNFAVLHGRKPFVGQRRHTVVWFL